MNLKTITRVFFILSALAFLAPALSACDTVSDGVVADSAPPVDEVEILPVISDPVAEIWRPGYWSLDTGGFVWIPGQVIPRPAPTAVWASARWVHHTYGWSLELGHWE
jgi:hypothetical protein